MLLVRLSDGNGWWRSLMTLDHREQESKLIYEFYANRGDVFIDPNGFCIRFFN
jgi:hypothetical protein